jgi:hypothetical protein
VVQQLHSPETGERVDRVREKLKGYLEEAAGAGRSVPRAFLLARDLVRLRHSLSYALRTLGRAKTEREHELVLREAELAYLRRYTRFSDAKSRSELLRAWTDILIEATDKVAHDEADAKLYAAVGADASDDDRAWRDASTDPRRERWENG